MSSPTDDNESNNYKPVTDRGEWNNHYEFFLSCLGLSVGLGNVWRFPYLAYKNGGSTFLVPYFILLVMVGKPLYYMELAIGQYAQTNCVLMWKCCPIMKGVGVAMTVADGVIVVYYNVLMAYALFYLFHCFSIELPWATCSESWGANLTTCFVRTKEQPKPPPGQYKQSSAEQYWEKAVLGVKYEVLDTGSLGSIKWDLAFFLFVAWVIVYFALIKGIKSSGKVVWITATVPYLALIVMAIVGCLQDGAGVGLTYLFKPRFSAIVDFQVWRKAAEQLFFSLSVSTGPIIVLGSYCPFKNRVDIDAALVSVLDFLTSIFAGVAIFSILGALSHDLGIGIEDVVRSSQGLAFIAYPEALSRLPFPQIFSALFFIMLLFLGLDSEFTFLESIMTIVYDAYPAQRRRKWFINFFICSAMFLMGLLCVTEDGSLVFDILDTFGGGMSLSFIGAMESYSVFYLYGMANFADDLEYMLGKRPAIYWKIGWAITPFFLMAIFILSFLNYKIPTFGKQEHTGVAQFFGWFIFVIIILQIPIFAVYYWIKQRKIRGGHVKFTDLIQPKPRWGPNNLMDLRSRKLFKPYHTSSGTPWGALVSLFCPSREAAGKSHLQTLSEILEEVPEIAETIRDEDQESRVYPDNLSEAGNDVFEQQQKDK